MVTAIEQNSPNRIKVITSKFIAPIFNSKMNSIYNIYKQTTLNKQEKVFPLSKDMPKYRLSQGSE